MRTYASSQGTTPRRALNDNHDASSDFANLNWTHTFSTNMLNEFGASMIRPYGANLPVETMAIPYQTRLRRASEVKRGSCGVQLPYVLS